jgi:putative SOS response-associated peptidase YedK
MCGRYVITEESAAQLDTGLGARWRGAPALPSYNIAPTQHAPVLHLHEGERFLEMYRWGLIRHWARDASIGARTINARAETVASKPSFRTAFRERRCLVPASGYYEWQATPEGKQPHFIAPADGAVLTFAGLWEEWRPAQDAEPVHTFTILTTAATGALRSLHERMPVVLEGDDRALWLDPRTSVAELRERLRPAHEEMLRHYPVHRRVGSPRSNDPGCIVPLSAPMGEG